jgi:hypothetical protein
MVGQREQVKQELRKSNRMGALRHLKMIKILENSREKQSTAMLNLLEAIQKLKALHTDREVRVYNIQ